jgi:sugar lactone lactonase YvrE
MVKAIVAFSTLLLVACVLNFTGHASALLAVAGVMSALWLIALRIPATAGMLPRRARRGAKWLARGAAAGLLVVLVPALLWAAFGTAFRGVATVLTTGGLTLVQPSDVAVDGLGNVYVADQANNQIVEVTAAGVASLVSFPGLSLALLNPQSVAVDGSGNIYVADSGNSRVVELSAGVASVAATGSLLSQPSGLVIDAAGNLYIADQVKGYIVKVPPGGAAAVLSITGLATALNAPTRLAASASGNLYIADNNNNRIVVVAPGGAGSVLAITGGLTLGQPFGVAVDGLGNVYVSDFTNSRIVRVSPTGTPNVLTTRSLTLSLQKGIAVGVAGAVYVADPTNGRVVELQASTVGFGNLPVGAVAGTTLALPFSVANGTTLSSVQAFTLGTANLDFTVVPAGTTCTAGTTGTQSCNVNIQFLPTAAGLRRGAVVLFNNANPPAPILSVPLYGTGDAPLAALNPGMASVISTGGVATNLPFGLAFDGAGNIYCGSDASSNVIKIPAGGGTGVVVYTSPTADEILGVAVDGAGNLFIADYTGLRIQVVTPAGVLSVLTINGLDPVLGQPTALAFDAAGNLYIADYTNGRVVKVSSLLVGASSSGTASVLGTGTFTFSPSTLTGLAVDAGGTIYLADRASRVVKLTAAGAASLVSMAGFSPAPSAIGDVAVDGTGNLSIVDAGHGRILQVTTAGLASVVKMTGVTNLSPLFGAALDPAGNVYVPDWATTAS